MKDFDADGKITWHDVYEAEMTPITAISIKLGDWLFTPLSALIHTIWFVAWFALGLPIDTLTLIVSLEAIYITLFIGLGQKMQDKRSAIQAKADKAVAEKAEAHREKLSAEQAKLLDENTKLTEEIERLTAEIHKHLGLPDPS